MEAFETHVHDDGRAGGNERDPLTEFLGGGELEVLFAVFTNAVGDVEDVDVERVGGRGLHPSRVNPRRPRLGEIARVHESGNGIRHVRRDISPESSDLPHE